MSALPLADVAVNPVGAAAGVAASPVRTVVLGAESGGEPVKVIERLAPVSEPVEPGVHDTVMAQAAFDEMGW